MMKNITKLTINKAIFYLCGDIATEIGSLGHEKKVIASIDHKDSLAKIMVTLMPNVSTLQQTHDLIEGININQEAANLLILHENITDFDPLDMNDLLEAHSILTQSKSSFNFKDANKKDDLSHKDTAKLMRDLFDFMNANSLSMSWLMLSSIFRYELENIHPFEFYNSEIGRFWQRVLLFRGYYIFAFAPLIEDECEYYQALEQSRKEQDAAIFVEYSLRNILKSIKIYAKEIKRMHLREGSNLACKTPLSQMRVK